MIKTGMSKTEAFLFRPVQWSNLVLVTFLVTALLVGSCFVWIAFGAQGLIGSVFTQAPFLKMILYYGFIGHVTITAMSLSFHRFHTHQGVKLNPLLDRAMQVWLWLVTSMSKRDWVSVHVYHHATSDTPKDPHSPVQKGFWHVFLLGAADYAKARVSPEVLQIAHQISENRLEKFIRINSYLGPALLSASLLILFGPLYGMILALLNFSTSLLFAVGGVNTVAHYFGYRNYETSDNSRNIGFVFPLNFIICGELDHNNHHRYPKSASFRHKWFEFVIGYFYLKWLQRFGLAKIQYAISPKPVIGHLMAVERQAAV